MINLLINWMVVVGSSFAAVILIGILIVVLVLLKRNKAKKEIEYNQKQNNEFIKIFGGKENIVSCEAKGSRLVLVLNDYSLLDEQGLKDNGVTSMIKATNKITLIVGTKSSELEKFIQQNTRPE